MFILAHSAYFHSALYPSFRRKNPHRIFRKLPLDNFPHSAIRIPQNTPSQIYAPKNEILATPLALTDNPQVNTVQCSAAYATMKQRTASASHRKHTVLQETFVTKNTEKTAEKPLNGVKCKCKQNHHTTTPT